MSHPHSSKYRPDIDGLRAIAVMAVVLYHTDSRMVPGGFVGVDVFFVISGFLITSILLRQKDEGHISLGEFYERRIRRIAPAFFAMLGAVLVAGFSLMMPWDFQEMAYSARYALLSASNICFNKIGSGYFFPSVEVMPLLHTWSLGVEEQFYFVFPLILWAATRWKWSSRQLAILFLVLGAFSFGFCLWHIRANVSDCFYLIPYRAWELMIGSLLALGFLRLQEINKRWYGKRPGVANAAGVLGFGMILWAMVAYDKSTLFPGMAALLPCVGTALVIAAGQHDRHWMGRILGWRPIILVGLVSYSVYLWHWPLLAFQTYFYTNQIESPSLFSRLCVGLAALPLGFLSWWLVERPFRGKRVGKSKIFMGWLALTILFLGAVVAGQKVNRLSDRAQKILEFRHSKNPMEDRSFSFTKQSAHPFVYGEKLKPATIALWGDSHADAIAYELGETAQTHGESLWYYGQPGNVPVVGINLVDPNFGSEKRAYNEKVILDLESQPSIKGVVLLGRWAWPIRGLPNQYGPAEKQKNKEYQTCFLNDDHWHPLKTVSEVETVYANAIKNTVQRLRAAGKIVFLVYPIPEVGYDVPCTLAREVVEGREPKQFSVSAKDIFYDRQSFILNLFDSLPNGPDLVRIKPHELLISNGNLRLEHGDEVFYFDSNHLSLRGAHELRPLFDGIFEYMTQQAVLKGHPAGQR